jgi:hypothetical protein
MVEARQAMIAELDRTGRRFANEIEAVPDDVWRAEPTTGTWSPELLAEHLALVEVSTARLIARRLFVEPSPAGVLVETATKEALLRRVLPDRGRAARSPEFVTPSGRWVSREDVVGAFREARAQTIQELSDPSRDLHAYAAAHPLFGPLTAHQWGVFLALHLERHLAQLDELLGRLVTER